MAEHWEKGGREGQDRPGQAGERAVRTGVGSGLLRLGGTEAQLSSVRGEKTACSSSWEVGSGGGSPGLEECKMWEKSQGGEGQL